MPLTGLVQVPTIVPVAPSGFQQLLPGAPELPNYQLTATVSLEDPKTGEKTPIATTSQLVKLGNPLTIPVSFETAGRRQDRYNYWLTVQDAYGNILFDQIIYPRAVFLMTPAVPAIPTPTAPTLTAPISAMIGVPKLNIPQSVRYGEIWTGTITIPTQWPSSLGRLETMPTLPITLLAQLEHPNGQRFNVGALTPSFQPGANIGVPINYDTSQLPEAADYKIFLTAQDLQGNNLLPGGAPGNYLGVLAVLAAAAGALPKVPTPKLPAAGSQFPSVTVSLSPRTYNYGDYVQIPVTYSHVGAAEIRTIRAAIGNSRPTVLGGFDEILWTEKQITVPLDAAPVTRTETVGVLIGKEISPGIYSVYAKVSDLTRQAVSPVITNVVQVLAAPAAPTIQLSSIPRVDVQLSATSVPVGGTLTIPFSYQHQGAQEQVTVYAAIGQRGAFGFDEILHASKSLTLPLDTNLTSRPDSISIPITSSITAWKKYGVYVKIQRTQTGRGEVISPYLYDIVTVTAQPTATVLNSPVTAGQVLRVSFSGFQPNSTIYGAARTIGNFSGTSDAQGSGTMSATVPSTMEGGSYNVAVTDSAGHSATAPFVVQAAPLGASSIRSVRTTLNPTTVNQGYTVQVPVSVEHIGKGETVLLYAAIGNYGAFGFDEILHGQKSMTLPDDSKQATWTDVVPITITSAIAGGKSYSVYVKVMNRSSGQGQVVSTPQQGVVTVQAAAAPTPPAAKPTATASPSTVTPGQTVTISYSGFQPNTTIYSATRTIGNVNGASNAQGAGTLRLSTPASLPAGTYNTAVTDSYGHSAIAQFTVQAAAAPPAAQPTLSVENSGLKTGQNLIFKFSGFQPSASVTVGVEGGGSVNLPADSTGAGYYYFQIGESAGTYTLYAQDNYGHRATTSFRVT